VDVDKIISKKDAVEMLNIINDCLLCTRTDEAGALINKLKKILEFDSAIYALARLKNDGTIESYETINFSYPPEWLVLYKKKNFHRVDPVTIENFNNFQLQYWKDTYKKREGAKEFISASKDFLLNNGYACGVRNQKSSVGSILSLAGRLTKTPRNNFILETLTPHLHQAFSATLSANRMNSFTNISKREKEVLNWLKQGKSTWDISMIFSISENTVKFHVNNIMTKLDAVSRTHAVAIALTEGLIDNH